MTDIDLIGYMLGALDPAEQAAVEAQLKASPEAATRLEQLRAALRPLEAAREAGAAPAGLADRTVARLAAHLDHAETIDPLGIGRTLSLPSTGHHEGNGTLASPASMQSMPHAPREAPETRSIGGRLRPDLILACAIAFFACGIVISVVGKVRARSQLLACQAKLQTLYAGLVGYADTHDGRYPQVRPDSTAESFAAALVEAGQVPPDFQPGCPAVVQASVAPASYTYTLGYQTPTGELVGLRRPDGASGEYDLLPISADLPTASAAPVAGPLCGHPPIMNVLYVGGNVRPTTSPLIGPNGDDIYRNVRGEIAAGVNRLDVVLGRPGDRP